MKIRKADTVKVLYGRDSGKTGKVLSVDLQKLEVLVEGLNMYKKHIKGDGQTKKSEIVDVVRPMSLSKLSVVCPHCNKATRIGMKLEGKNYVRTCKKCTKGLDVKVVAKAATKVETKKVTKKTK